MPNYLENQLQEGSPAFLTRTGISLNTMSVCKACRVIIGICVVYNSGALPIDFFFTEAKNVNKHSPIP